MCHSITLNLVKLLFAITKSFGQRNPHPDANGRAECSEVAEEVIHSDANVQGWHTAELWDDRVSALREHQVSPKQEDPTRDDIYRMGALDADGDALSGRNMRMQRAFRSLGTRDGDASESPGQPPRMVFRFRRR